MSVNSSNLPTKFGPYQLKQKIASGGMAEIFLAETTGPGGFRKPLVIKMIHHAYSDDKRFLAMFTEEAKILSSLTHGNIVPIFDFGTAQGLLYLAMEFIDGVDAATLMDVCRTKGITLPLETAMFIGIGTAAGLSHAHQAGERGVVHRDVSPQNILLSRSGEVKLCDFGLATYSLEEISSNEAIKGKLKYLSPEQARGEPVDGRSDLFSLGVVLYELIAGHHPIPTGSGVTVLQELAGGSGYPPLGDVAPWLKGGIADIVDKTIAFNRDSRYQTGEEMRSALSHQLHKDFPLFTPNDMAELVIRAQTEEERTPIVFDEVTGSDSIFRAQIASFASSARDHHKTEKKRDAARIGKVAMVALGGILLSAVLIFGWIFPRNEEGTRQDLDTDIGTSAKQQTPLSPPVDTAEEKKALIDSGMVPDHSDTGAEASPLDTMKQKAVHAAGEKREPAKVKTEDGVQPAKSSKATGTVNVNASPWADVTIDGIDYTTTPILGLSLKVGKHKAVFVNPELGITKTRTFVVKADETTTVLVEME